MTIALILAETFSKQEFALYFGLGGMLFGVIFGGLGMYFNHRKQAMWHETARIALEKGQPIPEPLSAAGGNCCWSNSGSDNKDAASNRRRGLLIGGLINIAMGIGLFIALINMAKQSAYFAAIPFFIGVALFLAALLDPLFTSKKKE